MFELEFCIRNSEISYLRTLYLWKDVLAVYVWTTTLSQYCQIRTTIRDAYHHKLMSPYYLSYLVGLLNVICKLLSLHIGFSISIHIQWLEQKSYSSVPCRRGQTQFQKQASALPLEQIYDGVSRQSFFRGVIHPVGQGLLPLNQVCRFCGPIIQAIGHFSHWFNKLGLENCLTATTSLRGFKPHIHHHRLS